MYILRKKESESHRGAASRHHLDQRRSSISYKHRASIPEGNLYIVYFKVKSLHASSSNPFSAWAPARRISRVPITCEITKLLRDVLCIGGDHN